jgi:hypothetical protein
MRTEGNRHGTEQDLAGPNAIMDRSDVVKTKK